MVTYIWDKDTKVPGIEEWINRFNQVSFWVGTEVCTVPIMKSRIAILEGMIKVLKVCETFESILSNFR